MLARALEAVHLLMDFQQVLKWPEGNDDQPEFLAEIEPRHVSLDQVKALARLHAQRRTLLYCALQHALGQIKPGDSLSRLRQRHGDAPRAATKLQHRIAKLARRVAIKRNVLSSPLHHRRLIVIVRDKRIVECIGHKSFFSKLVEFTKLARHSCACHPERSVPLLPLLY